MGDIKAAIKRIQGAVVSNSNNNNVSWSPSLQELNDEEDTQPLPLLSQGIKVVDVISFEKVQINVDHLFNDDDAPVEILGDEEASAMDDGDDDDFDLAMETKKQVQQELAKFPTDPQIADIIEDPETAELFLVDRIQRQLAKCCVIDYTVHILGDGGVKVPLEVPALCPAGCCVKELKNRGVWQNHTAMLRCVQFPTAVINCLDENCLEMFASRSAFTSHFRLYHKDVSTGLASLIWRFQLLAFYEAQGVPIIPTISDTYKATPTLTACRYFGCFVATSRMTEHKHLGMKGGRCIKCGGFHSRPAAAKPCESKTPQFFKMVPSLSASKFECDNCGKSFHRKSRLNRHLATHAAFKPRPFQCGSCGKTFGSKYHLARHLKTHDVVKPRPFSCDKCDRSFGHKQSVKRHLKTHAGSC
jgi:Zinc finger, C2H2 type